MAKTRRVHLHCASTNVVNMSWRYFLLLFATFATPTLQSPCLKTTRFLILLALNLDCLYLQQWKNTFETLKRMQAKTFLLFEARNLVLSTYKVFKERRVLNTCNHENVLSATRIWLEIKAEHSYNFTCRTFNDVLWSLSRNKKVRLLIQF